MSQNNPTQGTKRQTQSHKLLRWTSVKGCVSIILFFLTTPFPNVLRNGYYRTFIHTYTQPH